MLWPSSLQLKSCIFFWDTLYVYVCVYMYIVGRWRERPPGWESYVISTRLPGIVGRRSRITQWAGGSLNRPWTPIPPPHSVGSFCLEPIYLINYAVSSTGEPRPRHVLLKPGHSTDCGRVPTTDYQLRFGCSRAELPKPCRLGWTDYRI